MDNSLRWAIYIIRDRGYFLGNVEALSERAAVKAAIEKFGITDPERQQRLVGRRAGVPADQKSGAPKDENANG